MAPHYDVEGRRCLPLSRLGFQDLQPDEAWLVDSYRQWQLQDPPAPAAARPREARARALLQSLFAAFGSDPCMGRAWLSLPLLTVSEEMLLGHCAQLPPERHGGLALRSPDRITPSHRDAWELRMTPGLWATVGWSGG